VTQLPGARGARTSRATRDHVPERVSRPRGITHAFGTADVAGGAILWAVTLHTSKFACVGGAVALVGRTVVVETAMIGSRAGRGGRSSRVAGNDARGAGCTRAARPPTTDRPCTTAADGRPSGSCSASRPGCDRDPSMMSQDDSRVRRVAFVLRGCTASGERGGEHCDRQQTFGG